MSQYIQPLVLIHRLKKNQNESLPHLMSGFYLNTCQREFVLTHSDFISPLELAVLSSLPHTTVYHAQEAYCFLLQIITGLESALIGETEIFGQFKSSWKIFETKKNTIQAGLFQFLKNCSLKLLEDAKEIRTHYLQHLGSHSYGSLLRKILKDSSPDETLLFIGAGKIAQTTLPYFKDRSLLFWNRHPEKAKELLYKNNIQENSHVQVLSENEEFLGWQKATHIILCIPEDRIEDAKRIAYWKKLNQIKNQSSKIIHLGIQKGDSLLWESLPELLTLTDLFEMEKSQNEIRRYAADKALSACKKRAQLRYLGGHTTLPHGWEDLMSLA